LPRDRPTKTLLSGRWRIENSAPESATLDAVPGRAMAIRTVATVLLVAFGLTGSVASNAADEPAVRTRATFFITGHGWGHGLGMSQYGAYGYAQHGWRYDRIIKHYYTGVTIGQAPIERVRVLLVNAAARATISSKLGFLVVDATGTKRVLDAGSYAVGPNFKVKDADHPEAKPKPLSYPLEFKPGSTALALNGRGYRGSLRVLKPGAKIRVVNVVDLDLYLRGVVPSEMPKNWAPEALKAQAVAARSYALSHLHSGGGFDLYPDTRDQVYLGIRHEAPATTAAVNATAGQVALYKGEVARTYFFSTSGGRTASVQDLYPSSPPIPYLVSVGDKYDSISPYHDWGPITFPERKLARVFKVQGRLLDVQTVANLSGRVRSLVATGSRGESTVLGPKVRTALGLRSTWFSVGVLALDAPSAPVRYGSAAALKGKARGVGAVDLQQRQPGAPWQTVAKLTPRGGSVAPRVKPTASSSFRLVVGDIATDPVAVSVARSVGFHVARDLSGFWGTVKPGDAGTRVQIQRQVGPLWTTVATLTTRAQGRFTLVRIVGPGTYRARIPAGQGYVSGVSKSIAVS
jgi:stage II sporulation protein D